MRSLCLDLATFFGFAFGDDARGVVEAGSYRLPSTGNDMGTFLHAYRNWLDRAISVYQPDELVFEAPILPSTTNLSTLRKLYALPALTELIAQDRHCAVREANLTDIRMHFLGVPRAPATVPKKERREWVKARTIAECRARGIRPDDDNHADALALLSFICTARNPNFKLTPVPQFVEGKAA